jgi:hypothetical protein
MTYTHDTLPWVRIQDSEEAHATVTKDNLVLMICDHTQTVYAGYMVHAYKDDKQILVFEVSAFEEDKLVNIINTLLLAN